MTEKGETDPSDQEFDDWFNDAAAAEDGDAVGNQAAKLDEKDKDDRTCKTVNLEEATTKSSGQVLLKFLDADSNPLYRGASGTLVKKLAEDSYVFVTAAHALELSKDGNKCELEMGYFYLQKAALNTFVGKFTFDQAGINNFEGFDGSTDSLGLSGFDVAAVKTTRVKGEVALIDAAITELSAQDAEGLVGTDAQMIGYPNKVIQELNEEQKAAGESKYKNEGNTLWYQQGKIEKVSPTNETNGQILLYSMDASKGQDGGAVVNAEGAILGIYSRVEEDDGENFYCATAIDGSVMEWFNEIK